EFGRALCRSGGVGPGDVRDVDEVPGLAAVLEDTGTLAAGDGRCEQGSGGRGRRVTRPPGPAGGGPPRRARGRRRPRGAPGGPWWRHTRCGDPAARLRR